MPDVVFLNNGDGGGPRMMLVVIGLEGRWEEPHELDMFKQSGFQRVSLGSRVLRSDVQHGQRRHHHRSFTGDSGLAVITETAYSDCRGWQWQPMTMVLNNDRMQELATDEQRWHSAFIRCKID